VLFMTLGRKVAAEALGIVLLLAGVVGSGITGERSARCSMRSFFCQIYQR
jgi:hypothetical protein